MNIRLNSNNECIPFRVILNNESNYHPSIHLYREVLNPTTGQTYFQTYTIEKTGPLDGRLIHDPYLPRDYLQHKRFIAQSNNTTYVYDFPQMFHNALLLLWKEYLQINHFNEDLLPKEMFTFEELILDKTNQSKKQNLLFQ